MKRQRTYIFWAALAVVATVQGFAASKNEHWIKVVAPDFTLVTTLKPKEAVEWAGDFNQYVNALGRFMAVDRTILPPLTIVVFARRGDFEAARPLDASGKAKNMDGYFSRRESWSVAVLSGNTTALETRRTIFHEGTHWYMSASALPNPIWLEEGLAEVFSTFTVDKQKISWGEPIGNHLLLLSQMQPLPLEKLMFMTQDNLFTGGREGDLRTGLAYAESWAFVHYLVFGQRDVPQTALSDYSRLYHSAINPDDAFKKAFGEPYAAMDKKLAAYLRGGKYFVKQWTRPALPPLEASEASPFEVAVALAKTFLAAGRTKEALAQIENARAAAPDRPEAFELLGATRMESGEKDLALIAFTQAVEKKSKDYRPYFELALAEHAAMTTWDGSVGEMTPESSRRIANRYERAINLNPRFLPSFQNLAGLVELVPGNSEDQKFLEAGRNFFPEDGMIRLGLAVLANKAADQPAARLLLDSVLNSPTPQPPHVSQYAQRLNQNWNGKGFFEAIEILANEGHFEEALAYLEEHQASIKDYQARRTIGQLRVRLVAAVKYKDAVNAWNEQRWETARALFAEVAESDPSSFNRTQAKSKLEELDHRHLGRSK